MYVKIIIIPIDKLNKLQHIIIFSVTLFWFYVCNLVFQSWTQIRMIQKGQN